MRGVAVSPEASDATILETPVSSIQTGITVAGERGGDGSISGTSLWLDSGAIVEADEPGHFLALRFQPLTPGATVRAGMSYGELVELDEDMNGVFRVGDPETDTFIVESTVGGETTTQAFSLVGLVKAPPILTVQPNPATVVAGEQAELRFFSGSMEVLSYRGWTATSSDSSVAAVTFPSGLGAAYVAGASAGTATITINEGTQQGGLGRTCVLEVTVTAAPARPALVATPTASTIIADSSTENQPCVLTVDGVPWAATASDVVTVNGTVCPVEVDIDTVCWYWPALPDDLGPDDKLVQLALTEDAPGELIVVADTGLETVLSVTFADAAGQYEPATVTLTPTAP